MDRPTFVSFHVTGIVLLVAVALAVPPLAAQDVTRPAAPPLATDGVWNSVDIVPMPKRIELLGDELSLSGAVLVLGDTPCRQSEIGAEWINRHLAALGGEALTVVAGDVPAGASRAIVVGTRDDNPLIAKAAEDGLVDVGPGNPGPQGYEIRVGPQGYRVYLAGADVNCRRDDGQTPLHVAADSGRPEAVPRLLEHGADPEARDSSDRTPLQLAETAVVNRASREDVPPADGTRLDGSEPPEPDYAETIRLLRAEGGTG